MNIEKNTLLKLYSINYYPNNIEFNEIKTFFTFNQDINTFCKINEKFSKFTSELHGFFMKFSFKKFLKNY